MNIHLLRLIRPKQWVKNLFVLCAPFFGGTIFHENVFIKVITAALLFCFASSAIYCLNDILDRESDRLDPVKRLRPIASGKVSIFSASIIGCLFASASIILSFYLLGQYAGWIITTYIILNIAYCIKLKHLSLIDLFIIAIGFILRLELGGVVSNTPLSSWIIIMVFLLSIFLAMSKRRDELVSARNNSKKNVRKSAQSYTLEYLNLALSVLSAVILVAYIIYTVQPTTVTEFHTDKLFITTIFVLGGILRYLQITVVFQDSKSPTNVLLNDPIIISMVICWILSFLFIIYG